ncbi:MAG: VCBS repeat-containing protein, partial [Deltaproteobacteria bacterium]
MNFFRSAAALGACLLMSCGASTGLQDPQAPDAMAPPVDLPAPRPIAPLSTSHVTSRRPTVRWALGAATDGARVEWCRDRACADIVASVDAQGLTARPPDDLPTGVVFWRLRGRAGTATGSAPSPTWQFTVPWRSAPRDTSWGSTLDVNGDGFSDLAVDAMHVGSVYVFHGSAAGLARVASVVLTSVPGFGAVGTSTDVNGDGFSDLVASSAYAGLLYLGSADGLRVAPSRRFTEA